MKTAFSNVSDCLHVYAQQTQNEGRSSSVSFNRNKVYSYNQCIGNIQGNNIFLIDWNYSVTTGKHNSWLRQSISQYNRVYIHYPEIPESVTNVESFESKLFQIIDKLAVAKKPEIYLNELESLKGTINDFLTALPKLDKTYKKRLQKILKTDIENSDLISKAKDRITAKLLEAKEKSKMELAKFRNFETDRVYNNDLSFLRVNGENVETSKGISVEKSKILPLITIYKEYLKTKSAELLNKLIGKHIDFYTINSVNDKLVVIGCHKIPVDEILSIA